MPSDKDIEDDNEEAIPIYMSRKEALSVADFLIACGNEEDENLALNIRYQAQRKD